MSSLGWSELLAQLERTITMGGSENVDNYRHIILDLLHRYQSNEPDFNEFVFYDDSGYTKNLVAKIDDIYNIIVMCWAPGQLSTFHAHEGSKCFVKVLSGRLIEQQVTYPTSEFPVSIGETGIRTLNVNDVSYIDDNVGAHRVLNKSQCEPAITLHLYIPPYMNCRIFDTDRTKQCLSIDDSRVIDVKFYSEFGAKV